MLSIHFGAYVLPGSGGLEPAVKEILVLYLMFPVGVALSAKALSPAPAMCITVENGAPMFGLPL